MNNTLWITGAEIRLHVKYQLELHRHSDWSTVSAKPHICWNDPQNKV